MSNHGRLLLGGSGDVLAVERVDRVTNFPELYPDHRRIIGRIRSYRRDRRSLP
ncbi:MAG TPA: hypothetical protein V6C85_08400 [Allocoleopsis sp.]